MKMKNPYDTRLEAYRKGGKFSDLQTDAMNDVVDTLDLAWAGAQAVFEHKAQPEHALEILDRYEAALARRRSVRKPGTDSSRTKK